MGLSSRINWGTAAGILGFILCLAFKLCRIWGQVPIYGSDKRTVAWRGIFFLLVFLVGTKCRGHGYQRTEKWHPDNSNPRLCLIILYGGMIYMDLDSTASRTQCLGLILDSPFLLLSPLHFLLSEQNLQLWYLFSAASAAGKPMWGNVNTAPLFFCLRNFLCLHFELLLL